MSSNENNKLILTGIIISHAHDVFSVSLDNNPDHFVKAKLCGKMRLNKINLSVGDCVRVEVSPYDLNMGRIVSRLKKDRRTEIDISEDATYAPSRSYEKPKKKTRRSKTRSEQDF